MHRKQGVRHAGMPTVAAAVALFCRVESRPLGDAQQRLRQEEERAAPVGSFTWERTALAGTSSCRTAMHRT